MAYSEGRTEWHPFALASDPKIHFLATSASRALPNSCHILATTLGSRSGLSHGDPMSLIAERGFQSLSLQP